MTVQPAQPWPAPVDDASPARLSALMDGELSAEQLDALLEQWARDPQMRRSWHAYQVTGDVMRSADIGPSGHEGRFLAGLRERLAAEPVPFAPAPLAVAPTPVHPPGSPVRPDRLTQRRMGRRVLGPAAVAAGFVAVAGLLLVLQGNQDPIEADSRMVSRTPDLAVSGTPAAPRMEVAVGDEQRVLRDAQIDRYLRAHRPDVVDVGGVETVGGRTHQVIRRP